jgi:lipopolysaccharide biosynthesis glycosyltransferase
VVYATTMHSTGPGDEGLLASMLSLSFGLSDPGRCVIHLIVPDEDMASAHDLVGCFRRQFGTSEEHPHVSLHTLMQPRFNITANSYNGRLAGLATTFARFYLPEYMPGADRVIWIDTDTIVQTDIRAMYNITMEHAVAAVEQDLTFTVYEKFIDYIPDRYLQTNMFSAGIFVADLARWRREDTTGALEAESRSMLEFGEGLDDQLVLNLVFPGKIDKLDERWNSELFGFYTTCSVQPEAFIMHWSGPLKAWSECRDTCAPYDIWRPQPLCGSDGSASQGLPERKKTEPVFAPSLPSDVQVSELLNASSADDSATGGAIHVVYATTVDNSTGPGDRGLMVSMVSLAHGLQQPGRCVIHLIVPEAHLPAARELVACFESQWSPPQDHPSVELHAIRTTSAPVAAASLARFYLPSYLPGVKRVIWLDTDTIVQGDLSALYNVTLEHAVAAVEQPVAFGLYTQFSELIPMRIRRSPTFGVGVFVADLDRWRSQNASAALEQQAQTMVSLGRGWDDELVMNLVFHDNVDTVDERWNHADLGFYVNCPDASEVSEAFVLHWSGPLKAWSECRESCALFDALEAQVQCGVGAH